MPEKQSLKSTLITRYFPLIICLVLNASVFIPNFGKANIFWDEGFYITGAEKYKKGVFHMQTHPPLGKMFLALGDLLLNPNKDFTHSFENFDRMTEIPPGFTMKGYRIFPVIFGILCGLIFFLIFKLIIGNAWWALALSTLYTFDNAQVLQSRGALLDSCFTFFFLLYLYFTLKLFLKDRCPLRNIIYASINLGILLTVKDSAPLFGLFLFLALLLRSDNKKVFFKNSMISIFAAFIPFLLIWNIHFNSFDHISPNLPNHGKYNLSDEDLNRFIGPSQAGPLDTLYLIKKQYQFTQKLHKNIPDLNMCDPKNNGAPVWLWPFGVKAANYRWDSKVLGYQYSYLNIIANPFTWFISLLTLMLLSSFFFSNITLKNKPYAKLLTAPVISLFILYLLYMFVLSTFDRTLYLHSYFPALNITYILFGFLLAKAPELPLHPYLQKTKYFIAVIPVLSLALFLYFSPFTYGTPMDDYQFQRRNWLDIWGLKCQNCPPQGIFLPKK